MKYFLFPLFATLFLLTACKDDDSATPCDATDVEATIVGDWNETPLNGIGDEVTFNADMTGSCTEQSLFSTEVNGNVSTTFTWDLSSDFSTIDLSYPNSLTVTYNVVSVDCDEVVLELFGFNVKLKRK